MPGDTKDVAPSHFRDGDADVAGVPSGVSARPSQSRECVALNPPFAKSPRLIKFLLQYMVIQRRNDSCNCHVSVDVFEGIAL